MGTFSPGEVGKAQEPQATQCKGLNTARNQGVKIENQPGGIARVEQGDYNTVGPVRTGKERERHFTWPMGHRGLGDF